MNQRLSHIAPEHLLEGVDESFFQAVNLPLPGTKDRAWLDLTNRIDLEGVERPKSVIFRMALLKYSIAATILLLISVGIWAGVYTEAVHAGNTQHVHVLPDGSEISLSAQSEFSFHPYWWFASRELSFEGEAYFRVEKGARFKVVSEAGTTEVLGTSFTINTFDKGYTVFCETGKVRISNSDGTIDLLPGELASLNKLGQLELSSDRTLLDEVLLTKNTFSFETSPLDSVLKGLAKHYKVQIEPSKSLPDSLSYTGFFTKPDKVEDALHIVSLSLGLTFEKVEDGTYKVSK